MEVRAEAGCGCARRRLLRRRQSRGRLMRRPPVLQHARRHDDRAGRRQRRRRSGGPARRHQQGRDHDHGAAGRGGQSAGRQLRRRVRRARLARRRWMRRPARSPGRPAAPAGHRRADRPGVQAVLRDGAGQGPRRDDLAAGGVEDRRRHRLGLDLVRSRARPDLLRHRRIPVPGTPSSAPATTSGPPASSPATPTPGRRAGSINGAARPVRP